MKKTASGKTVKGSLQKRLTVVSGLPDSDVSDDEVDEKPWYYVWPPQLVRHFMKVNNQKKQIAEKYDEFRLNPLEAIYKEIGDLRLDMFYKYRKGCSEEIINDKI